ncbi:MAG: hypothetical protein V4717_21770 [Bacteroidota bacterium]
MKNSISIKIIFLFYMLASGLAVNSFAQPINRKAVVERHTIEIKKADSLSSLSIGNGAFAFTVDVTGLQTFQEKYAAGVPLGTQSEWGWHSFPNTKQYKFEEALKSYHFNGRDVSYAVQSSQPGRAKEAADYFRQNVHRLQLGNIGFELTKKDGTLATLEDITGINQQLNMWTGEIHSRFQLEGVPVDVITYGHQQQDAISTKVVSPLLQMGRLQLRIRFPYPNGAWADAGVNYADNKLHQSTLIRKNANSALLKHVLDTTNYYLGMQWKGIVDLIEKQAHYFLVKPQSTHVFEFTARFDANINNTAVPVYEAVKENSITNWSKFWRSGAAVDLAGSTDTRAHELERRIITSQYLTKIQCAGNQPPQETGLTYNSWYGKPHLEMHWWHAVHFALWNRTGLLQKSLNWYPKAAHFAYDIAKRQGYDGLRWQKVTDNIGRESPSSVGAMLIWQQPHFIYMAELCRRKNNDSKTINQYKDLVFATADFMASFAHYDSISGHYRLGKGLIPAQERFKPEDTFNPTYELAYWFWALRTAQDWRLRLNLGRNEKWDQVMKQLSPLPVKDNMYLAAESAPDSYTNPIFITDHPSVLGTLGMLPKLPMTDSAIMLNTYNWIEKHWTWKDTWGWDFPMVAMAATRLGQPEKAIDALMMPIRTNTYLPNGHNYQDERLTIYLPGNGGLLASVALMCAGYDGCQVINPGFPKNGKWKVRWEGFVKMP